MSGSILLEQFVRGDAFAAAISVDQYHCMIDAGALQESSHVELLDGYLVLKDRRDCQEDSIMIHGPGHSTTVQRLSRILDRLAETCGCHARSQQPISIPPHDEPEPDVAVVHGADADYEIKHPEAGDVLLLVEVSVTSLRFDRETKLPLYAAAGIPEYWIVDVNGRRVEVYSQPQALESGAVYQTVQVFSEDQQFTLTINSQTFGIKPLDFLPANRT